MNNITDLDSLRRVTFAASVVVFLAPMARAENESDGRVKSLSAQEVQARAEKSLIIGAAKYDKAKVAANDFCQCINVNLDAALRIEQALAKPLTATGLDFADTPLKVVVEQLEKDTGIPFAIDSAALEEAGVGTDAPVTIRIRNISMRSALALLLKPLALTFVIENEFLLVTTKEAAEATLKTCVYDVRPITSEHDAKPTEALIKTIQLCIAKETWTANRSHAEISAVRPGVLVITQTQVIHEQIHELLATIKRLIQSRTVEGKTNSTAETKNRKNEPVPSFATKSASGAVPQNGRPSPPDDWDLFR